MSEFNCIRNLLNIKDKNIVFSNEYFSKTIKKVTYSVLIAKVDENFPCCHKCNGSLIKYGTRASNIKLPESSLKPVIIRLIKQRYQCTSCKSILTSTSKELVDKYCHISNKIKSAIIFRISNDPLRNINSVSKEFNVSHHTVMRTIKSNLKVNDFNYNYLPETLCFDEFKSCRNCDSAMSFVYCDGDTHDLIGIVDDRKLDSLRAHFHGYSFKARSKVKEISIDMYSPYISLIKEIFPNAKIVFDRFHIVQLVSKALNQTRIALMNRIRTRCIEYKRLKTNWKLLLKKRGDVNYTKKRYNRSFRAYMADSEILEHILNYDNELRETYWIYQKLLTAISEKDTKKFVEILNTKHPETSEKMRKAIRTLRKNLNGVIAGINSKISNGPIEGINNKIKVVKRVAFGYRNMDNFKLKIALAFNKAQMKAA